MIRDAEIRRIAAAAGTEPRIVDLDYALGWALWGLASHESLSHQLVFKGGTCLRKCYFPDYRFSEDLDFTATGKWDPEEIERALNEAFRDAAAMSGIDLNAHEPRLRIVDDEYGRESLKYTIYWRGPHPSGGSPPGLRLDITRHEVLLFEPVRKRLLHQFSDAEEIGDIEVACYVLEEVMAEKIRAVLGQRIYAVSRDLYDIYFLRDHVADDELVGVLPKKFAARDVDLGVEAPETSRFTEREAEFEADWERNLVHLLHPAAIPDFAEVWETAVEYVTRIAARLEHSENHRP